MHKSRNGSNFFLPILWPSNGGKNQCITRTLWPINHNPKSSILESLYVQVFWAIFLVGKSTFTPLWCIDFMQNLTYNAILLFIVEDAFNIIYIHIWLPNFQWLLWRHLFKTRYSFLTNQNWQGKPRKPYAILYAMLPGHLHATMAASIHLAECTKLNKPRKET